MSESGAKAVYAAIGAVQAELASGIAKSQQNEQQGFMFRGIDDVYKALSPALVRHGLLVLPRYLNRVVSERESRSGSALFYCVVEAEFDLVSVEDGSVHIVRSFGEALDTGDKATSKAMSICYKSMAFQVFCIPVADGGDDPDKTSHEVKTKRGGAAKEKAEDHLDSLKKKIWAKADGYGVSKADIKQYSVEMLGKGSSKDWSADDCDKVLAFIEYRGGN